MEVIVFFAVLFFTLGDSEETYEFIGVGNTLEEAKEHALEKRREDEYLNCVQYDLVGATYGTL